MDERSEHKLVSAAKRGDKQAYASLVKKYYKQVFAACYGILANADDAEDIAQDAMLTGYLKIGSLLKTGHFAGWILHIARNLCIDLLRRKKHVKSILSEHTSENNRKASDEQSSVNAAEPDVSRQIRKLPLELRLPLVMYYFDNKNAKAIAEQLNISHSSACSRLREARKQLHILLNVEGRNNEQKL